jgi:hypothetical protein
LNDYLQIKNVEFFKRVFPGSGKYGEVKPALIPYFLGRIALESDFIFQPQWGIETIYNFLGNDEYTKLLEKKIGFSFVDFFNLTKKSNIEIHAQLVDKAQAVQALTSQVAGKEQTVQALTAQVAGIESSRTWKIALLFRRIRALLAPPNSRRARMLRFLSARL